MQRHSQNRFARLDPFTTGRLAFEPVSLRFGARTFRPEDVTGIRVESGERAGLIGSVLGGTVFLLMAAGLMEAVVEQTFPYRTLIGAATVGGVGLAALQDAWLERGSGFYRLYLSVAGERGEILAYASGERAEIDRIVARLTPLLAQPAPREHPRKPRP